jgi:hypothetical protein
MSMMINRQAKETLKNSALPISGYGKAMAWSSIQLRFRLFQCVPKRNCCACRVQARRVVLLSKDVLRINVGGVSLTNS